MSRVSIKTPLSSDIIIFLEATVNFLTILYDTKCETSFPYRKLIFNNFNVFLNLAEHFFSAAPLV